MVANQTMIDWGETVPEPQLYSRDGVPVPDWARHWAMTWSTSTEQWYSGIYPVNRARVASDTGVPVAEILRWEADLDRWNATANGLRDRLRAVEDPDPVPEQLSETTQIERLRHAIVKQVNRWAAQCHNHDDYAACDAYDRLERLVDEARRYCI